MHEKGPLTRFFDAYVRCALWLSIDNDDEPMDNNYDQEDIDQKSLAGMRQDCEEFVRNNKEPLDLAIANSTYSPDQAGHDFWLTRNGHGAGFWDRDLGDVGDRLTQACEAFGECHLYVGDDGKLHI